MKRFIALLIVAIAGAQVHADNITFSSTAPPATPLAVSPGSTSSPIFITISNDVGNDPATSFMMAWQFRLVIQPIGGATGSVTFNTPATGSPSDPPNYIFAAGLGISVTNGGSFLTANDIDSNTNGTQVPVAIRNLLQFDLNVSAGATGNFGIYAQQGAANTLWTDAVPSNRFFVNVPNGSGLIEIGEITIAAVPEPGTIALMAAGAGVCGIGVMNYRRRLRMKKNKFARQS